MTELDIPLNIYIYIKKTIYVFIKIVRNIFYKKTISFQEQTLLYQEHSISFQMAYGAHRSRGRMVVAFTTTYAIGAHHHLCCEFEYRSGRGVQHYVISLSVTWSRSVVFSGYSGFLTNKTECHDITEILLKVSLNTIKPNQTNQMA